MFKRKTTSAIHLLIVKFLKFVAMKMNPRNLMYPGRKNPVRDKPADGYEDFDATELYCQRCKQAVPVRKRLLLVLPEGEKYEYLCAFCSASVGTKMDRQAKPISLIV
jgi:hypothetical protein